MSIIQTWLIGRIHVFFYSCCLHHILASAMNESYITIAGTCENAPTHTLTHATQRRASDEAQNNVPKMNKTERTMWELAAIQQRIATNQNTQYIWIEVEQKNEGNMPNAFAKMR